MPEITWKDQPSDEDYEAALSYLSLLVTPKSAASVVERLRAGEVVERKADDIWRASGGLSYGEPITAADGDELSPVLLIIAGDPSVPLIVAGGYRSVFAALSADPESTVPCKITTLP